MGRRFRARLRHLAFIGDDPLLQRFVGLSRVPTERSLGRALPRIFAAQTPMGTILQECGVSIAARSARNVAVAEPYARHKRKRRAAQIRRRSHVYGCLISLFRLVIWGVWPRSS
jgi:hypothetical protein